MAKITKSAFKRNHSLETMETIAFKLPTNMAKNLKIMAALNCMPVCELITVTMAAVIKHSMCVTDPPKRWKQRHIIRYYHGEWGNVGFDEYLTYMAEKMGRFTPERLKRRDALFIDKPVIQNDVERKVQMFDDESQP